MFCNFVLRILPTASVISIIIHAHTWICFDNYHFNDVVNKTYFILFTQINVCRFSGLPLINRNTDSSFGESRSITIENCYMFNRIALPLIKCIVREVCELKNVITKGVYSIHRLP